MTGITPELRAASLKFLKFAATHSATGEGPAKAMAVAATCMERDAEEIERLRAALKPFAEAADDAEGYSDDHAIGCEPAMELSIHIEAGALAPLKVSHLRATKRALGESEQPTNGKSQP